MKRPTRDQIAIMDTTLRDGEQTPDVAYTPGEKLQLARLLLDGVGVDRIEIAQTHVSQGERQAAARVLDWARKEKLPAEVMQCLEKEAIDGAVLCSLGEQDILGLGIGKFGIVYRNDIHYLRRYSPVNVMHLFINAKFIEQVTAER